MSSPRFTATLVVFACSAPPRSPQQPPSSPSPQVATPAAPTPWIFRQLTVGALPRAHRTTFTLTLAGDRATLIETAEQEPRSLVMADADRFAHWTVASVRTYRGPVRRVGGARDLELSSDGVQPLELHCESRTVAVASASAQRVASPAGPAGDCGDRGVWEPSDTTTVDALICTPALQHDADADADDDDRFVFGAAPGIEWAFENDDCVLQGGGLRRIAADHGAQTSQTNARAASAPTTAAVIAAAVTSTSAIPIRRMVRALAGGVPASR